MSSHFADRLLAACAAKGAPVCVGIDPVAQRLPITADDPVDAIERWTHELLDAVTEHVPVVKFQSACYERHGGSGQARAAISNARVAQSQAQTYKTCQNQNRDDAHCLKAKIEKPERKTLNALFLTFGNF